MTYADKYDTRRYSTYRFYRDIRHKANVNVQIGRLYPNVLDHIVLDDDDVNAKLIVQVAQSHLVDDAAASIQRFASRCLAADKSEMMVNAMSQVLMDYCAFPKPIIDVLLFYGAKLDPKDSDCFMRTCLHGMNDDVKQAIENGRSVDEYDVRAAIESGNCDTIKLVFSAYRGRYVLTLFHLFNATVQSLELCMSLNVIERETCYSFSKIPSFSVLQWILDHDVMEHDRLLIDIASNASCYSGHYFDMLRYLIEQRNFTVPRDILLQLYLSQATDSDVFDYLLSHGADVNSLRLGKNVLERSPMLIRYWIDKGFAFKSDNASLLILSMHSGITAPVLEMIIDKFSMNESAVDKRGSTLLHEACKYNKYEVVEMLLRRGADVNSLCSSGSSSHGLNLGVIRKTPYEMTYDDRIRQLLVQFGYKPRH